MTNPTMLILRGNDSPAGTFPDEQGKKIAWPIGALHVQAASDYARRRGYEPLVLNVSGRPNDSQHTPQVKAALKAFHEDASVAAFYGFSGGGYNLVHILEYLSANEPELATPHQVGCGDWFAEQIQETGQEEIPAGQLQLESELGGGLQREPGKTAVAEGTAGRDTHSYVWAGCFARWLD